MCSASLIIIGGVMFSQNLPPKDNKPHVLVWSRQDDSSDILKKEICGDTLNEICNVLRHVANDKKTRKNLVEIAMEYNLSFLDIKFVGPIDDDGDGRCIIRPCILVGIDFDCFGRKVSTRVDIRTKIELTICRSNTDISVQTSHYKRLANPGEFTCHDKPLVLLFDSRTEQHGTKLS
jgi:hypothetical protein